jgi:hypothetical protein
MNPSNWFHGGFQDRLTEQLQKDPGNPTAHAAASPANPTKSDQIRPNPSY